MLTVEGVGQPEKRVGKDEAMEAREGTDRQVGGDDAIATRLGAAALPLGIIVLLVSEFLHPQRELKKRQ